MGELTGRTVFPGEATGEPLVLVEAEGPVLVVTINRPEKKNAANAEVLCRLSDAWVRLDTDDEIEAYLLQTLFSSYHPTGTCRMGANDGAHVVDHRLRVHGLAGIRVADASIMPTIPSSNTNAPAIMIGEKAAQMVLQDLSA